MIRGGIYDHWHVYIEEHHSQAAQTVLGVNIIMEQHNIIMGCCYRCVASTHMTLKYSFIHGKEVRCSVFIIIFPILVHSLALVY